MVNKSLLVTAILFSVLIVSAKNIVLAQDNPKRQDNEIRLPFEENFEKNEQLVMPWANIICQITDKAVNPPNCPIKITTANWLAASSLTLYNRDGTIWYSFSLRSSDPRHFLKNEKEKFLPFSTDFGDEGITLRVVAESSTWYEVEINEVTQSTKFILKNDPLWVKVTWNYFLAKVRVMSFDGQNKPLLYDKPNGEVIEDTSELKWNDLRFRLKIEGEWAFVEGYLFSKPYQGWVKWRRGREMLFKSKIFKHKFGESPTNE